MIASQIGRGVCATSEPRMLKVQATLCGSETDERVRAQFPDHVADAEELASHILAREFQVMRHDLSERRRRPVGPDRVHRIGIHRHELRAHGRAGPRELLGPVGRVQPGIVAEGHAGREIFLDPLMRGRLDEVRDFEQRSVDLIARLQGVAAVDEQHGPVEKHDCRAGRSGEAREPREPLFRGRHILVLVRVGAGQHEARQSAALELCPQGRHPRGGRFAGRGVVKGLELGLKHLSAI